jgi:hypothetical protein
VQADKAKISFPDVLVLALRDRPVKREYLIIRIAGGAGKQRSFSPSPQMTVIYREKSKGVYPSCSGVGWSNKDTLEDGFAASGIIT